MKTITLINDGIEIPSEYNNLLELKEDMQTAAVKLDELLKNADHTDAAQVKAIKAVRLELRTLRTSTDKERKILQSSAKQEIEGIQNIWNTLKAFSEDYENKAKEIETRSEREQEEAEKAARETRIELLTPYVEDLETFERIYQNIGSLEEEIFEELLSDQKALFELREAKAAAIKKEQAEKDKFANEAKQRGEERLKQVMKYAKYLSDIVSETQLAEYSEDQFSAFLTELEETKQTQEKAEKAAKAEKEKQEALISSRRKLILGEHLLAFVGNDLQKILISSDSVFDDILKAARAKKALTAKKEELQAERFKKVISLSIYSYLDSTETLSELTQAGFDDKIKKAEQAKNKALEASKKAAIKKAEAEKAKAANEGNDRDKLEKFKTRIAEFMKRPENKLDLETAEAQAKYKNALQLMREAYKKLN